MPYRANNVALEIQVASMTTVEQDIRYTISVETSRKSHCELPKWIYIKLSNGMSSHCSVNSNRYDTVWFCFFFPSGDSSYLFPFRKNKNRLHARHTQRERDGDKSLSHFLSICFQQLQTFPLSSHPLLPKKNQQHDSEQTWQWKKKKKQKIKLKKNIQVKWIKNV